VSRWVAGFEYVRACVIEGRKVRWHQSVMGDGDRRPKGNDERTGMAWGRREAAVRVAGKNGMMSGRSGRRLVRQAR
jgi:hypothetical protein